MNSFDKSIRLKGKVEEDRYFAKLDQDRLAALDARQQRSPASDRPGASRNKTPGSGSPETAKQAKS